MVQSLTIDLQSRIMMLENALASLAEGSAPHSSIAGYPLATICPPGWTDNNLARWCELDYDQPRERFVKAERLRWWVDTDT